MSLGCATLSIALMPTVVGICGGSVGKIVGKSRWLFEVDDNEGKSAIIGGLPLRHSGTKREFIFGHKIAANGFAP
jgi:hypothetical protein